MTSPRLHMSSIRKRFGATVALDGVDLDVHAGQVLALIGENGAGKSTLIKVLAGAVRPDAGAMRLDGRPFRPDGPQEAREAGVAVVYQELNLAPHLTVEQNIALGVEHSRLGFIRRSAHRERIAATLARMLRPDIRLDTPVHRLSPAERQLVEIARALLTDARVLVLDEPTSSLGLADIEHLFEVIAGLRSHGVAVIYISHFLEEVRRVADRYCVLRDGRAVGRGAIADASLEQLVEMMIGRKLDELFPRVEHSVGEPILHIAGLTGRRLPVDVDLTLHRGEILGMAGLIGAGRTELLRSVFGLAPVVCGEVRVAGYSAPAVSRRHTPSWSRASPTVRLSQGVGLLSEDRQTEGLALSRSITDNVTLSRLGPFSRGGWVNPFAMRRAAADWIERLGIRARGPDQRAGELSGGNQQKAALARLLHHDVDVLLLDEPTRGIDIASKAQIYRWLGELAARGKAVLVVSSSTPELLGVCDRIAVMHRGRIVACRPAADWTEHAVITTAVAGKEAAA